MPEYLQRAAIAHAPDTAPPIVHDVLRSPGQPLDDRTRAFMEPRFGHDFSGVRVHTDADAADSARAVRALAYTVGQNVVFGAGQYAPATPAGRNLMAHELTHVVQQRGASVGPLAIGPANSPAEHEAAHAASTAGEVRVGEATRAALQRQPQLDDTKPRNVGPPLQEIPLPPRCSIIWKDGKFSWKCEGIPKLGSTPEIPLDPRDIPDRIKDLVKPKGTGDTPGGGPRVFPVPPAPGSDLPPDWIEGVCRRNPRSPLCLPLGGAKAPDQPKSAGVLGQPTGVFFTFDVLFEHDQPSPKATGPNGGLTAEGVSTIGTIVFLLSRDSTMQVRLIGHASSEGGTAHNMELSKRRARLVYQRLQEAKLGARVADPIEPDGRQEGCGRIEFGVWACGEAQAVQTEARPEERKVAVTFLRNPPLPAGPLKLQMPRLDAIKTE
jgi:outer membrane protein OmpA-like peptidoglycan-associated protein